MNLEENQQNLWLDCDPGIDDTFALILACHEPKLNLIGVSTSNGNSSIEHTTANCLKVLNAINKLDIQVIKGSIHPYCYQREEDLHKTIQFHGPTGLPVDWPTPQQLLTHITSGDNPFTYNIYQAIKQASIKLNSKVSFVVTGPMTNLALVIRTFPNILQYLDRVLVMGGCLGQGNVTKYAEFNMWSDPQAANVVLQQKGLEVVMVGLDATHRIHVTPTHFQACTGSPFKLALHSLLTFYQNQYISVNQKDYLPCHDDFTMFYLIEPDEFITKKLRISVETQGERKGQTAVTDDTQFQEILYVSDVGQKAQQKFTLKMIEVINKADSVSIINKSDSNQQ